MSQIQPDGFGLGLAREAQQIVHDALHAQRLALDRLGVSCELVISGVFFGQLGISQDDAHGVVNLVGEAGRQLADRRQLGRLDELSLGIHQFLMCALQLPQLGLELLVHPRVLDGDGQRAGHRLHKRPVRIGKSAGAFIDQQHYPADTIVDSQRFAQHRANFQAHRLRLVT